MRQLTRAEFDALSYRLNNFETRQTAFEADAASIGATSGTLNAAIINLSGTINARFSTLSSVTDGSTITSVTGVLSASPLSGTIDARFINVTGSLISGISSAYTSLQIGVTASIATLSGTAASADIYISSSLAGVYSTLKTGGSASIVSAYTSLQTGVTASIATLSGTINSRLASFSGTLNTIPKWTPNGLSLGDSPITTNGTTTTISENLSVASGKNISVGTYVSALGNIYSFNGNVWMDNGSINSGYGTAGDYTLSVNNLGYNEGQTQFRNLYIKDGKGSTFATFTGVTRETVLSGALVTLTSASIGGKLTAPGIVADGTTVTISKPIFTTGAGTGYISAFDEIGAFSGNTILLNGAISFYNATNATATAKINSVGYLESTTQFRSLQIQDGKGANIATFTGETKQTVLSGNLVAVGSITGSGDATFSRNVGIGTATPLSRCHIVGITDGQTDGALRVVSNKNAWGNITSLVKTTAGGSTIADSLKISIDSGFVELSSGGGVVATFDHSKNTGLAGDLIITGSITGSQIRSNTDFYVQGNPLSGTINAKFASLSAAGALINVQKFTVNGTYTPSGGTNKILVKMVGGGGGGGGGSIASGSYHSAGGGASGVYWEKFFSTVSATGSVIIGAGAAGGNYFGGAQILFNGSTGGDTALGINTITYVAKGGMGGSGSMGSSANIVNFRMGGQVQGGSSTGDISFGERGQESILKSYSGDAAVGSQQAGPSGKGGSTPFGAGGDRVFGTFAGNVGTGYGSGGGGAVGVDDGYGAGAMVGASGSAGVMLIYEYA